MNKLKTSIIARVIAWVVLFASASVFLMSCIMALYMEAEGIFTCNYDDVRDNQAANISNNYSYRALAEFLNNNSNTEDIPYFEGTAFRYGIIKADDIDKVNLNDPQTYETRNFTKNADKNDLHIFSVDASKKIVLQYYTDFLRLNDNYFSTGSAYDKTLYADSICYDTAEGIFYYHAQDGKYYPAQSVTVPVYMQRINDDYEYMEYYFVYDIAKHSYSIYDYSEATTTEVTFSAADYGETTHIYEDASVCEDEADLAIAEEYISVSDYTPDETLPYITTADKAYNILLSNADNITFDIFKDTALDYNRLKSLCFDDVRYIGAAELTKIDSVTLGKEYFPDIARSYIDSNYTLHIQTGNQKAQNYYVVSYVDEEVLAAEKQAFMEDIGASDTYIILAKMFNFFFNPNMDFYLLNDVLLDAAYDIKDKLFAVIFCLFALSLLCLIFLMCAAGHRKNSDKIATTFIDKIPLDLLLGIYVIIFLSAGALISEALFVNNYVLIHSVPFILLFTGVCTLIVLLSFCVRIKLGKCWRTTITYTAFSKAWHVFLMLWHNIGLLWKPLIILLPYAVIKILIISEGDESITLLTFFMEMLILAALSFISILQFNKLYEGSRYLAEGDLKHKIDTSKMLLSFKRLGENLNSIGEGMSYAVDERMKSERFKTELITNVSHDIKTPLTSIINYVDLLEKTDIQDKTQLEYLDVLKRQSAKLKKLIEDLIEASKASTGNLAVNPEHLEIGVFLTQLIGEFNDRLESLGLELIINKPATDVYIDADGRHLWRVVDNLMNNICKYAQPNSRVYINLEVIDKNVIMTFKNISRYPLNISSDELMERFVRGDSSRNTEGNGLGLSIAQSLMELMKGSLSLYIDGDLFKVTITFPAPI